MRGTQTQNEHVAKVQLEGAWLRHGVVSRAVSEAQSLTAKDGMRRYLYFEDSDQDDPPTHFRHHEIVRILPHLSEGWGTLCATVSLNANGGADVSFWPAA